MPHVDTILYVAKPPSVAPTHMAFDTTLAGAIIAATASILVLVVTIIRDRKVKRRERQQQLDDQKAERQQELNDLREERDRQRNNLLRYLSSLVHGAVRQGNVQIANVKTYAEALDKNPYDYDPLHIVLKPDLETIATTITEEIYFNSYVDQYKEVPSNVEEIKVIFSSAKFISGQIDKLHDMSNYYYSEDNKKHRIISEAIQEVIQTLFEIHSRLNGSDVVFNKFFAIATDAFENYNTKRISPSNVVESHDLFLVPLMDATKGEFANVTSIAPIINPLRVAKNSYYAIEFHCRSYLQEIKLIHEGLIESVKQLRDAAAHLVKDYPIISVRGQRQ